VHCGGTSRPDSTDHRDQTRNDGLSRPWRKRSWLLQRYDNVAGRSRRSHGRKGRAQLWGGRHTQQRGGMAPTGKRASVVSGTNKNRVRASMAAGNSGPGMGVQEAQKEVRPGQNGAQRALLLERAREAAVRLAELVGELAETGASTPPDEAGLEERLKAAAAALQMTGPECQATNVSERGERSLAVGVLRAERLGTESRWQCKVPTCAESYHPLVACLQFLLKSPEERMDLVATASLCRGCLTPGHGAAVRTCPFHGELKGLCTKLRCKQSHHQLLHMEGKPELRSYHRTGRNASEPVKQPVHIVAATAHLADQPPAQLVTQRVRTAAGEPCITFWDTGSQVTLMTHGAAIGLGLKPIPGPPLNLMGVGNGQRTRSTVRYKVPLVNTGGGQWKWLLMA
jgi:hypothetical protein